MVDETLLVTIRKLLKQGIKEEIIKKQLLSKGWSEDEVIATLEKIKGKTIYCSSCGEENESEAEFCGKCGVKLLETKGAVSEKPLSQNQRPKPKNNSITFGVASLALGVSSITTVLLLVFGYVFTVLIVTPLGGSIMGMDICSIKSAFTRFLIVAMAFGVIGIFSAKQKKTSPTRLAKAGFVLSIISLTICFILLLMFFLGFIPSC
jgi:ribosomal protein L40E